MIFHFYLDFLLIIFFQSRSQRNIEQQCTNTSHTILYKNSFSPFKPDFLLIRQNLRDAGKDYRFSYSSDPEPNLVFSHSSHFIISDIAFHWISARSQHHRDDCCLDLDQIDQETATGFPPRCIFVFLWSGNCCSVSNMVKYPASILSSQYTIFRYLPFK